MKDNRKLYNQGLNELQDSITLLTQAVKSFSASSNATDDFPTARHEIMDVSTQVEKLLAEVKSLHDFAFANRIR